MSSSDLGAGNFVDKIKNIDGKIVKDGKLKMAMCNIPHSKPGAFVGSLDGEVRVKDSVDQSKRVVNPKASSVIEKQMHSEVCFNHDVSNHDTGMQNSFASLLNNPNVPGANKAVRLTEMKNNEAIQGSNVAIPLAVVEEISNRFENTLCGYFIGKRLAFPLVENYVKNSWAKFGLERLMLTKGLTKDTITSTPIWVKLHNVPIVAYSDVGLSLITSQLGRPIMLDAYMSTLCTKSWGRNNYARVIIEVSSLNPLKESLIVAIPFTNGTGHSLEMMDIEYEWLPPRCDSCKIFDLVDTYCPKCIKKLGISQVAEDDGFTKVNRKHGKKRQEGQAKQVVGIKLSKPKTNFKYRAVTKQPTNGKVDDKVSQVSKNASSSNDVPLNNNFSSLMEEGADEVGNDDVCMTSTPYSDPSQNEDFWQSTKTIPTIVNDSDSEEMEELILENHIVNRKKEINANKEARASCEERLRIEVDHVQSDLDKDSIPNQFLSRRGDRYVESINDALLMEERFLKQKAKIEWLHVGDSNSAYFHKVVKGRIHRSMIDAVTSMEGTTFTGDQVPVVFEAHYSSFLGQQGVHQTLYSKNLFINRLDPNVASFMIRPLSNHEIKEAIFSMGNDKSQGPDEFFTNGNLLKEVNHTIIALIPKEIMHNYHLDRGPPRCAFKVDIQKAYDTVNWVFLLEILVGFGFHPQMVTWIMECVSSTSFSLNINGTLHGFFKGKRGLHQGDPLSPYLFTLVIEVLTLMLHRKVGSSDVFTYHRYCDKLNLINLYFADDLFLFAHGDANSTHVIMACLDEFKDVSRLVLSLPKSTAYFCNVLNHSKLAILNTIPFEEGRLPVKYLGVPLISSRLIYRYCKELIDKVRSRINDWKNKSLSAAGRGFLWCQGDIRKGNAKVAWDAVCLPKKEGGLGIRKLDVFNKALMVSHIWNLLSLKESLWVGNGANISSWFDRWSSICPLSEIILPRDIHRTGFTMNTKLSEIIVEGQWVWPHDWFLKHPILSTINVPSLIDSVDSIEWRHLGVTKPCTASNVWESIHPRRNEISWYDVVWFPHCIPRHAFRLWLVIKRKLKTQDNLRQWDVSSNTNLNLF
ncbi:hypothetical protein Tco_0228232 [Tanacetum coccineum]